MEDFQEILPVTKVKRELLNILKRIEEEDATIALTRNGEAIGIMMPLSRYEALLETIEILADKKIIRSLQRSRRDFEAGRVAGDDETWKE